MADHVAILNFNPQIIILMEDIISSEIRLSTWRNIMFIKTKLLVHKTYTRKEITSIYQVLAIYEKGNFIYIL
jgi:hypothetical protein